MAQYYFTGLHFALPAIIILIALVCGSSALKCYQCGQYTDGVGSITPCLNFTEKNLKQCPKSSQQHCIKYVTEGSIVRECAEECVEKRESWGTKVFCCTEDGCNSATNLSSTTIIPILMSTAIIHLFRQVYCKNYY